MILILKNFIIILYL